MHRRLLAIPALATALLAFPSTGTAQHVGSLLAPRGSVLFEAGGSFTQTAERFGADGRVALGRGAFDAELTPARFPALAAEQDALRTLLADPSAELRAGHFAGVFEVNDQRVPFRIGYGLLDRVTLGVTVPIVRRRVDAHLQATGVGANVGENPARGAAASEVTSFQSAARSAFQALQASVTTVCSEEGEDAGACVEGRAAEARVGAFLDQLDAAWAGLDLFPLGGSSAGASLRTRWEGARAELATWGASGPETLPLATGVSPSGLRSRLSDPVWSASGFPSMTPDADYALGDVEAHLVVGLLGTGAAGAAGSAGGLRVRSAVEATLRIGTGVVDSFAVFTPMEPLSGHGGIGVRWVTDLLAGERAGILVDLGWRTFFENSGVVLAADPDDGWNVATRRLQGTGAPGDRLRIGVTPRLIVADGISLGAGLEYERTAEALWRLAPAPGSPQDPDGAAAPPPSERLLPEWSTGRAVVELRFAGWEEPFASALPFPVELRFRGIRAVTGSGNAPVETRFEMGARLLRRR
jgi:hypothetical protein